MSSYLSKLRNLIPSWRDNVAQFEVYIYEGEYSQIEDWVLQKDNIETGGDLFGLWIDSHKAVVQFVLGPGTHCQRSNVSFYQDISYLSNVGDYLLKNHGLCNIGQWHSHHRIKLDRPSVGDERTVWDNLPDLNLNSYIVFIATIKDGREGRPAVDVNCFLFELDVNGSPLPVLQGQFKKINKDSPMRIHCEILECSSYGAEPVEWKPIDHSGNQQGNIESGSYDARFSTSSSKNKSEKNACWIELENVNELENTNEQPKVLKQDEEKEEGIKEGLKEDEKEGEKEGKEKDEKEEEKEGKEEERKEEEVGKEEEKKEEEGKEEGMEEKKEEEGKEEGMEEKKEEEGKEEGKEKEEEGMEEKKKEEEVEEGKEEAKEKGEQQERKEDVEREEEEKGEQQEEEEELEREEEKEEVKCKTGNMSKGEDTLDNLDAIGTESREMQLAEQEKKEMEEYGRESKLEPQDTKETIKLLQKSTNCNTNVKFEDGKCTKNERKDNKTTKESDGDKSKENGEGKPGNMTSIEAHVKELPESVSTKINFDETRSTKNESENDKATKKNEDPTKQKGEVRLENISLPQPDVEEMFEAINTEMNFDEIKGSQEQKANMENEDKSRDQGKLENIKCFEQRVEEMPEVVNTEMNFDEAVKHDEMLASSTDENTSTENGDKERKTAAKDDNPEETSTGSKDNSHANVQSTK